MNKEFRVAIGDRIFGTYKTKEKALEVAQAASAIYRDRECRLVYKNWNNYKGTPVYVNGEVKR